MLLDYVFWMVQSGVQTLDHVSLKSEQLKIGNFSKLLSKIENCWYSENIDSPKIGNFKDLVTLTIPEFKNYFSVKPPLASLV